MSAGVYEATVAGLDFVRRQEIVDEANTHYFNPIELGKLASNFSEASFFDLTDDFTSRMLPECYPSSDGASELGPNGFLTGVDLADRYSFLRDVSRHIMLDPSEIDPCAGLLGVRAALLMPALAPKSRQDIKIQAMLDDGAVEITTSQAMILLAGEARREIMLPPAEYSPISIAS